MSRPVPDVPIAELNARSEHVKLLDVQVLSDNWYVLRKVTCSLRRRDGQWQTMSREAYDRGNGAALLLFDPRRSTVVLTRQFRLPAFLNGCADGLLIETARACSTVTTPKPASAARPRKKPATACGSPARCSRPT